MSDELDTFGAVKLSEIFAVEVLGREIDDGMMRLQDEVLTGRSFEHWVAIPNFADSTDAVMPILHREYSVEALYQKVGRTWTVKINGTVLSFFATAETFARAACIVLIRATRALKGQS